MDRGFEQLMADMSRSSWGTHWEISLGKTRSSEGYHIRLRRESQGDI